MNKKNYRRAASILVTRATNKADAKISNEKKEADKLFFWILCQFENEVAKPLKRTKYGLKIQEKYSADPSKVILHSMHSLNEYTSEFVSKYEFYQIVEQVTEIFKETDGFVADCITPISERKGLLIEMNLGLIIPK